MRTGGDRKGNRREGQDGAREGQERVSGERGMRGRRQGQEEGAGEQDRMVGENGKRGEQ